MKPIIKIFFIFLLSFISLFASQKQAENIAKISAVSLYNINKNALQDVVKAYVNNHPDLKALKVTEILSKEVYIEFYKKDGKIIYDSIPKSIIEKYKFYKTKSVYENEEVGVVEAYFEEKNSSKLNSSEIAWIRKNPAINIAVIDNYPPYDYRDKNNNLIGFHSDLVKMMNKNLGTNIVLKPFDTWSEAYFAASKGNVHGIFSLSWSKQREDIFNYTTPYHFTPYHLIVKNEDNSIKSIESLVNKKIAVEINTIFLDIVKEKVPSAKIVLVDDTKKAYEVIQNGEAIATISPNIDEIPLDKYDLKIASEVYHKSSNVHIGINKKFPLVYSIVNKGIESVSLKDLASLRNKWIKKDESLVVLTKEEKAWLKKHPSIILGADQNWQPFDFRDRMGLHSGFNSDYIKLLRKKLGVDIKVELGQWQELQNKVENKELAGLVGPSKNAQREEYMAFTQAYFLLTQVVLIRNSSAKISSLNDLNNKTLGLKSGSSNIEYIKNKFPNIKRKIYETNSDIIRAVSLGEIEAGVSNIGAASYEMERNFISNIKVAYEISELSGDMRFGVRKDWPMLASILQKGIDAISREEMNEILNKWLKLAVKPENTLELKLTKEEKLWLKNNPAIRLAYMNHWVSDDEENNIHTEYAGLLSKYGNLNITFVKYDAWKTGFEAAKKGEDAYGILNLSWSKEREKNSFNYTKPYFFTPGFLIVKKDNKKIKTIEDLANGSVYLKEDAITNQIIKELNYNINVINLKTEEDIYRSLSKKDSKAQALLTYTSDPELLERYDLKIANKFFSKFGEVHLGISKNQKELFSIINKIYEIIPKSELTRIQNKIYKKTKNVKVKLTQEEKEFISKHRKIRVHNEKSWAPFNFYEKGRARGLSIDYANLLLKNVGLEPEFITGPTWNEFIEKSKTKDIDLMLNIAKSPAREKFLNFTTSYMDILQSVFIKEGSVPVSKVEDLFGKTFAVPKGFYYEEVLKEYPQIKLLRVQDTLECMQAVSSGKADAMLDLISVVNYYKNKYNIQNVVLGGTLGIEGGSLPLHMATRKDWPILAQILNKSLRALSDEEINKIEEKWLFNNAELKKSLVPLSLEEKKWIRENIVTVGIEEWAPVIFSQGGKSADGISGEVLKLVQERTGLRFKIINDLWSPLLNRFKNKEIDLLPATYYTDERAKYGLYSTPYYKMLDYIYVKENNSSIKSLEDLNGKTLAIPKGFGTIPKIRKKFPKINIVETLDLADSIRRVLSGEVDALYDGQIAVEYYIQENLIQGIKGIPQKSFNAASLYFFSHMDKPILRDILNKALKSIPPQEINKIKSKWILLTQKRKQQFELIQNKDEMKLSDILPIKEIIIGLVLFLILFYLIWKYQIKTTKKDFALKGTLFVIIAAFLILASAITVLTMNNLEKAQKEEIKESLTTVLNSEYKTIKLWIEAKFRRMDIALENENLNNLLLNVGIVENYIALDEHFHLFAKVFEDSKYYLLSKDFKILSNNAEGSKDLIFIDEIKEFIEEKNLNRFIHLPYKIDDHTQEEMLFVKVIKHNGKNLAYLVMEVNPNKEFSRILQNGRIGDSGETYAYNKHLQLISNSRFDEELRELGLLKENENSFLNIELKLPNGELTHLAKKAIEKQNGINIDGYLDYRGYKVYGAWIWDNELQAGIATEIDEMEAMGAFNQMKKTIFIIVFSIVIFTMFLSILVAWISSKSKKSLQIANDELNKLLESFDDNVIASKTDKRGIIKYASKAFCEISGYTQEELIGSPQNIVRHPDMPKTIFKDLWSTIQSGHSWRGEVKNKKKDGGFYWVDVVIEPEFDDENNIIGYSAIRQDITSKKEVEDLSKNLEKKVIQRTKLIEDQKQYTDSIMNSQSNIVISTDGTKLRTANKAFFKFFGVKDVSEFLSTLGNCICDRFDTSASKEFIQKNMGEEKWIEYVYNRPNKIHKAVIQRDGVKHIFSITSDRFEFSGETLEVAVFTDITEIEEIRRNIETILSNIMLPVLITSKKDRVILYANDYASKQYESSVEELVGSSIDHVYTNMGQKDEILKIMKKQGYVENLEEKYKTRKGKEFIGLLSVKPILYNAQEAFIGMVVDITKQKEIEEEIRRIHKHTQSSIEYASLIQHSLIPSNDLFRKYFADYFTIWHPKDIVGGDIYLFDELRDDNECLLMVIDCTGHGVPGAFVTMLVKAIERQVAAIIASDSSIEVSPAWILKYFNQTMKKLLKQENEDAISNAGLDGAILYYNKKERIVRFAGAELPLFYIDGDEFKTIKGNRHSIGYKKSDANYEFKEHLIEVKEGMQFYLTTDGYLDQNGGEKGFPFGKKRFLDILQKYKNYSFADQQEVLLNSLQEYQQDEERNDDVSVVGIKIGKAEEKVDNENESWVI